MTRLIAFAWLVVIGTNGAESSSQEAPYQGAVILAGAAYCVIFFQRELLRLVFYKDYLLVLSMTVLPLLLMLLSDRSFARAVYTSQISVSLVFIVASVLALQTDLGRPLLIAAFVIVVVGVALNLYELLVANNTWSIALGRSGGFYVNPNYSSEALLGYGLIFLTARMHRLRIVDIILIVLVIVGIFPTFSRAGIVASLVLLTAVILMRIKRESVPRTIVGVLAIWLFAFVFLSNADLILDLSPDAQLRIDSLLGAGGVGDYQQDRGATASAALDLVAENPVFGAGVHTIYEMPGGEGPHNMFVAMMVDYGICGLIVYLVVIIRLILIARRADRDLSGLVWFFCAWLVIFSFASHNLLGNTATIPLMGFTLVRAYRIQFSASRSELSDDFAR